MKIIPWALAHLNAKEVSRVAVEARKKSKVLVPIRNMTIHEAMKLIVATEA